jgi:hypothetical protein
MIGLDEFHSEVDYWAKRIRVAPRSFQVRPMSRKWASCSSRGLLSFSSELLDQGKEFRDYVVVHELLHLKIPNHGKLFKGLLSAILPDWKTRIRISAEDMTSLERGNHESGEKRPRTLLTQKQIEAKRAYARNRARMIRHGTWKWKKRVGS